MCREIIDPDDLQLPPRDSLTERQRLASAFPTSTGMSNRQRLEEMNNRLPESERLNLSLLPRLRDSGGLRYVEGW